MQRLPGLGVDVGFECGFEGFVGVAGTQKVGVAHEEAFFDMGNKFGHAPGRFDVVGGLPRFVQHPMPGGIHIRGVENRLLEELLAHRLLLVRHSRLGAHPSPQKPATLR